jgi:hypothetical protein
MTTGGAKTQVVFTVDGLKPLAGRVRQGLPARV